ncbi:hypothetical protein Tco_0610812 [Tanacetum coccineum]
MKQNKVSDDALRLYLFPYSLTHHSIASFDRLLKNSIHTFQEMALKFLSKYFPPSMLLIDRFLNHNMLPVTQIDMFYNGLTLRHSDTINTVAEGTFMKSRPEECYDLIKNMTAHHNDWDTSTHRSESSSSSTSSSDIAALAQQMIKMRKDMLQMYRSNQQVNYVTPSCETCGGPHSYYEFQADDGYIQDVYATTGNYNSGGNAYQPQGNRNPLSYCSNNFLGPSSFNPPYNQNQGNNQNFQNNQNRFNQGQCNTPKMGRSGIRIRDYNQNQEYNQNHAQNSNQSQAPNQSSTEDLLRQILIQNQNLIKDQEAVNQFVQNQIEEMRKALQEIPQDAFPSNTIPNPQEEIKAITT